MTGHKLTVQKSSKFAPTFQIQKSSKFAPFFQAPKITFFAAHRLTHGDVWQCIVGRSCPTFSSWAPWPGVRVPLPDCPYGLHIPVLWPVLSVTGHPSLVLLRGLESILRRYRYTTKPEPLRVRVSFCFVGVLANPSDKTARVFVGLALGAQSYDGALWPQESKVVFISVNHGEGATHGTGVLCG